MKKGSFEILIGFLVLLFSVVFLVFFLKISGGTKNITNTYKVYAKFANIEGIVIGSDIKMSGIKIGNVNDIYIDNQTYSSVVVMKLTKNLMIPTDSLFKVSTSGLIGSKYIRVDIGSDDTYFKDDDHVEFTESTMDLEDLVGRFIFNSGNGNDKK